MCQNNLNFEIKKFVVHFEKLYLEVISLIDKAFGLDESYLMHPNLKYVSWLEVYSFFSAE